MIKRYLKLQTDIMKAADKYAYTRKPNDFDYTWFQDNDNIYVIVHSVCIITVPKLFWYLDNDKVFEKPPCHGLNIPSWLDNANTMLNDTGELKKQGTITLHKFILNNQKAEEIYLSEELLKFFDLEDCNMVGSVPNAPVFIMRDGSMEGLILPVSIGKKG